jgi:protein phosphatase
MNTIKTQILSASDVGLVRTNNEDFCDTAETPNGTLCVLCDGMGGHAAGEVAAKLAVESVSDFFGKEKYAEPKNALNDALEFANLQICNAATQKPELHGMGTTACVLLQQDDKVFIAHAGDSRIYLFVEKTQKIKRLTNDHSYVQMLVNQGIITEKEAEKHPQKNQIVKALGITKKLYPEVAEKPILPAENDIFLLCTDGLSGMITDKEMKIILAKNDTLQQKSENLMSAAKAAGGTDNITFQLVKILKSPHKKSKFEGKISKNLFLKFFQQNKKTFRQWNTLIYKTFF